MCNAVKLAQRTERFNQEAAELPVLARDGSVRWIAWGGRFGAEAAEGLPPGPCARLESIKAGRWRRCRLAKLVKLADKICNLRDIASNPPTGWSLTRKREYFDWAKAVVDNLRDAHPGLEAIFDESYRGRP